MVCCVAVTVPYEQGVGMRPHASEGALPLLVETMGVQQKPPYPSSVCARTVTVYIVAGVRPVIVKEFSDARSSWFEPPCASRYLT